MRKSEAELRLKLQLIKDNRINRYITENGIYLTPKTAIATKTERVTLTMAIWWLKYVQELSKEIAESYNVYL